ncbi:MAG TPA: hypothetical protein PK821_01395 [Victivallales bacterium]|nr:hypothetical protein [Victivallales bacterium]
MNILLRKRFIFLLLFVIIPVCLGFDFGVPPAFDYDEGLDLEGKDNELRLLGPIAEFSSKENPSRELYALRPVVSSESKTDLYAFDVLWPLFAYRENNFEKYWRFFLLYSGCTKSDAGEIVSSEKPHSGLIPFWFYGKDENDARYWALFPLYGETRNFLSYDYLRFIMFPIYLKSHKGETHGESYFWPIWNKDESPSFRKFRFFPFYAYHDRPRSFYRSSYAWPFYHRAEYYTAKDAGSGWMLWPIYGQNRFKDLKTWSVLWPFFSVYSRPAGEDGSSEGFGISAPWPIIQYKRNADRNEKGGEKWKFYIWPLIGRSERANSEYQFAFWPLVSSLYTSGEQGEVDWVWILPLYWSKHARDSKGSESEVYRSFYPIVSYLKRGNFCEVRILDLWFQRNMPAVERNWSPLWILFDYQSNASSFRYDFLWGMFKYYSNPMDGKGMSIFPFYRSRSNFEVNVGVKEDGLGFYEEIVTESEEEEVPMTDYSTRKGVAQRDYLMGILRSSSYSDGALVLRFFWLFDLEF